VAGTVVSATISRRIEWWDTDASGHYHNAAILRMSEACEAELMRSLGIVDYFGRVPRVRQEVTYEAKLYFGQEVTLTLGVERLGPRSLTFVFEAWGEEHDGVARRRAAVGRVVVVHVPVGTERSEPWPDRVISSLEAAGAVLDDEA
jgi:acyl-CoA thioester hydrolase